MTLAVRPKPPAHHKKRTGQHRKQSKHYAKAYWPYLPILAVFTIGLVANTWLGRAHHDVLGYATEMSVQNLLDNTNTQRANNGESNLSLNAQLDQAAQAKANDMAARDYWSHNTPDGQTPWTFVTAAGYNYQAVGENLAYGFDTSADTLTGWMNSPGHRANILNSTYRDVGFGVINIPNYQSSGPQTLVVAFYGLAATTTAAPAPTAPVAHTPVSRPTVPVAATPVPDTTTPAPTADSQPTPTPVASIPATTAPTTKGDTLVAKPQPIDKTVQGRRIARVQLFTAGNASWSMLALTLLSTMAVATFAIRHALAWHRFLRRGERFVLHHPAFDVAMIGLAMLGYILAQTSGFIR